MGSVRNARIMYEPNAAGNASAFTANGMRRAGPGLGVPNEKLESKNPGYTPESKKRYFEFGNS